MSGTRFLVFRQRGDERPFVRTLRREWPDAHITIVDDVAALRQAMEAQAPDLVILVVAPGENLAEACGQVRQSGDSLILVIGAHDEVRYFNSGVDACLPYTLDPELLRAQVGALLRRRQRANHR